MENNFKELKTHTDTILKGLDGLMKNTESNMMKIFDNMSPDHAKKFKEEIEKHKLSEQINSVKKDLKNLNKIFENLK